jgi:hypothetical protein
MLAAKQKSSIEANKDKSIIKFDNIAIDVASFLAYQAQVNSALTLYFNRNRGNPNIINTNPLWCANKVEMLLLKDTLWNQFEFYLSKCDATSPNSSVIASVIRLIHVLACSDDDHVLNKLWESLHQRGFVQTFMIYASDERTQEGMFK